MPATPHLGEVAGLKTAHSLAAPVRTETRALLSPPAYRTRLLVALSLGWAALQAGRFLIPPLLPRIQADLALSPALVGGALTGFGLV